MHSESFFSCGNCGNAELEALLSDIEVGEMGNSNHLLLEIQTSYSAKSKINEFNKFLPKSLITRLEM